MEMKREEQALSLDELEAVSGGADRDWPKDGCAATVEYDSWCGSNDYCNRWDVTYRHAPTKLVCPLCGNSLYLEKTEHDSRDNDEINYYRCRCGYLLTV